ncbi:MAG: hypothetical protein ABIG61_09590 [Planctomycetota bacterium]
MKRAKGFIIAIGVLSITVAVIGLWYNLTTLFTYFSDFVQEHDIPYFYPAFYTMSAICIGCYIILLICGVQFVRLRTNVLKLFVAVIIFEVVYFFSIGTLWLIPNIGMSIGAATGVANGGLMFQAFILFPLWAPFLAGWAAKRLQKIEELPNKTLEATS